MIRHLINNSFKGINAEYTAASNFKRGTFVKVDVKAKTVSPLTTLGENDIVQVAVRGEKNTLEVSAGFNVSDYDDSQDIILKDECLGVETIQSGEELCTTEYDSALTEAQAEAGEYLTITGGKLATSATATKIISLGWYLDAGHKTLAFTVQ